ncbi:peptidase S8 [Rufibacter tibetensis]|uniref:Peptidase S8 n=2 Tax=Rufibacter tibetensis TaxID=512763 RepID=A0A0P0CTG9_9BACT|nr:peptidase S8 [Rufibacter tibetensis]
MKKSLLYFWKYAFAATVLSASILTSCDSNQLMENEELSASQQSAAQAGGHAMVPNEVLVKFKAGSSEEAKAAVLARISGKVKEKILTKAMERAGDKDGLVLVHTPMAALDAVAKAKGLEVEYAEPNWIYTHDAVAQDSYYTSGQLWGMYGDGTSPANQYGSQAGEAWGKEQTGSSNVVVGIIDEGIQITHPDLDANIWINPREKDNGVDDDGNGYIDDINGWDFDGNDETVYDGGSRGSLDDHGTHVAGTIGAEGSSTTKSTGVVGVNWNVKMISCKFLGRRGGSLTNAIKALDYLTDLKTRYGINIVATNNSWGGGGFSQGLLDAIVRSAKANILFIAAAGNGGGDGVGDNNDLTASYPSNYNTTKTTSTTYPAATYDAVIAVAAITKTGAKSTFSNFGVNTVDIGAPGSDIWSTTAFNTYSSYNGTSMATPHVTGAAALYKAIYPSSTAEQIKDAILLKATNTPTLDDLVANSRRLNVSSF